MDCELLTIRQVAKQAGVSSKALRYWEHVKLLPKPHRNYNDYRLYKRGVIDRVIFIQKAKSLGFTLAEIRALFELAESKGAVCADVVRWTARKVQVIQHQIMLLSQLKGRLIAHQKEWKRKLPCPPLSASEICCLIDALPITHSQEGGDVHAIPRKRLAGHVGHDTH